MSSETVPKDVGKRCCFERATQGTEEIAMAKEFIEPAFVGICATCGEGICTEDRHRYFGAFVYHQDPVPWRNDPCIPPDLLECNLCGELEDRRRVNPEGLCPPCGRMFPSCQI